MSKLICIFFLTLTINHSNRISKSGYIDFLGVKLNKAIVYEKSIGSIEAKLDYIYQLGEGSLYPNTNKYQLENAKTFFRIESKTLVNRVNYYYTKTDSIIKVVMYEWNEFPKDENELNQLQFENKIKYFHANQFQVKFEEIQKDITREFGKPIYINIESGIISEIPFRDHFKWVNKEGVYIYLFMFGNNSKENGYRQIRMIVYKD